MEKDRKAQGREGTEEGRAGEEVWKGQGQHPAQQNLGVQRAGQTGGHVAIRPPSPTALGAIGVKAEGSVRGGVSPRGAWRDP